MCMRLSLCESERARVFCAYVVEALYQNCSAIARTKENKSVYIIWTNVKAINIDWGIMMMMMMSRLINEYCKRIVTTLRQNK